MSHSDNLLPEGLADKLPERSEAITLSMRAVLDVLWRHGYDRVRPPLVEFEKSLTKRMDGLQTRKMFRFVDPVSLRTLALRSDITPQIGRIAATSMADAPRPLRLAYCGEIALIKADQLAPSREQIHLGGELIGSDSVAAVSEIVSLTIEALSAAGVEDISVDFTLPDLVDTLSENDFPLAKGCKEQVRRELDMKDAGGLKSVGGEAYLPLLYATGELHEALTKLRRIDSAGSLATRIEALEKIGSKLKEKARITLDPTERHGFEYQSWFGFTIYADGVRGALGRGGTYRIGGREEVATGFTLYVDKIAEVKRSGATSPLVYLQTGYDEIEAERLRRGGYRTIYQIGEEENPLSMGCSHRLEGKELIEIET